MGPRADDRSFRLGLIINPVAGMGGRVGLKGSDGPEILRLARERGAVAESEGRAKRALDALRRLDPTTELLVGPGEMGEVAARAAGFSPRPIGSIVPGFTTANDTTAIARAMGDEKVRLLMFAGGDGTARDVLDAVGGRVPILGIPAGVKVYSAVFATNPCRAGELATAFAQGRADIREAEVLDLDEEEYRAGGVAPTLYGYAQVPYRPLVLQGGKTATPPSEAMAADAIAAEVVERMVAGRPYILGPGTTTRAIAVRLGIAKTLVGVDVVRADGRVLPDADERALLRLLESEEATLIVTPIGGQGFLFGRGNPQISPRVLALITRRDILVVATPAKLAALSGRPLLVDTGDPAVDASLVGYLPTITGYREQTVYPVVA